MIADLSQMLRSLCENRIEFIIVGGLAAVLQGAPVDTFDLDVVYSRDPDNLERLLKLLADWDAIFRMQPHRKLRPNVSHLSGHGHINLITKYGPFDLLAQVGDRLYYPDLLPHSTTMQLGEGYQAQVLNLEKLIELKEQLGQDKDLAALPSLRQALRQRGKPTS